MENAIIDIKNVNLSYGTNYVLRDFSLSIKQGEFLTVIGTSGCGKTTVLKLINGLITPQSGDIFIEGNNLKNLDLIKLRRHIGYVIQDIGLFPHLTIEKNMSYVLDLDKNNLKKDTKERVLELAKIVGLDSDMLKRYPSELSGGQKQRVGIARALSSKPKILLMDEPFGAVDEITRKKLQDEIKKIYEDINVTIVFVTHDIKEALKLGTKILIMDSGKILRYDTPKNVTENPKNEFVSKLLGID